MPLQPLTEDEYPVVKAAVDLMHESERPLEGETGLGAVVRLSGKSIGIARDVLTDRGVEGVWSSSQHVSCTRPMRERLEALVEMGPAKERSVSNNNTFNINTGAYNNVQAGDTVSGNQTMVTTQQVFDTLIEQIQKSPDMSPEQKSSAIKIAKDWLSLPGISEIVKGVFKHYFGG